MKRFFTFLLTLAALPALGQSGTMTFVGPIAFMTPNGNPFLLSQYLLQTGVGPMALPYYEAYSPVPFQQTAASFLGYNQAGTSGGDWHCGAGGCYFWVPNNTATAWSNILFVSPSGTVYPAGNVQIPLGNFYYLDGATNLGGITGDGAGGISFQTSNTVKWKMTSAGAFLNASGQAIFPSTVTTFQGASAGGPLLVTGTTGTGSTGALSGSPAFTGAPTAPTATFGTNTTQLASTAFVQAAVTGSVAGVSSIDAQTGAFTFAGGGVSHVGNAYTFSSTSGVTSAAAGAGIAITGTGSGPYTGAITIAATAFHADVNITGAGTIAAQACSAILQINLGSFGSFGTGAYVSIAAQSNYTGTTGWSPIITPITPTIVPDPSLANYVDVKLCNTNPSGGASITPSLFGARILVVP